MLIIKRGFSCSITTTLQGCSTRETSDIKPKEFFFNPFLFMFDLFYLFFKNEKKGDRQRLQTKQTSDR